MGQVILTHLAKTRANVALTFLFLVSVAVSDDGVAAETDRPTANQLRFFETTIRPLLVDHCYECHGADEQESELRVDSLQGLLTGGKAGPSLVPGKPTSSLIVTAVSYRDSELRMPPEQKLSDRQIADLTRWIQLSLIHI